MALALPPPYLRHLYVRFPPSDAEAVTLRYAICPGSATLPTDDTSVAVSVTGVGVAVGVGVGIGVGVAVGAGVGVAVGVGVGLLHVTVTMLVSTDRSDLAWVTTT